MRLDTECDVTINAALLENPAIGETIRTIRNGLIGEHLAIAPERIDAAVAAKGLIEAIESLRGTGKTLVPYVTEDLGPIEAWLADHEVLDPEGPDEMLKPCTSGGCFAGCANRSSSTIGFAVPGITSGVPTVAGKQTIAARGSWRRCKTHGRLACQSLD